MPFELVNLTANTLPISYNVVLDPYGRKIVAELTDAMLRLEEQNFISYSTSGSGGRDVNAVLSGAGAPQASDGIDGDFWINTTAKTIQQKSGGAWGATTSLVGPQGNAGTNGTNGATILSGTTNPGAGVGANGDWYFNTTAKTLWGPKAAGAWPGSGTALNGTNGTNGTNGNTILNGTVDPTSQGVNGDFYINTATNTIFGPKTGGAWGSGTPL